MCRLQFCDRYADDIYIVYVYFSDIHCFGSCTEGKWLYMRDRSCVDYSSESDTPMIIYIVYVYFSDIHCFDSCTEGTSLYMRDRSCVGYSSETGTPANCTCPSGQEGRSYGPLHI